VIIVRFAFVPCLSEIVCYYGCMCWLNLLFGYENIAVVGWTVGETCYSRPSDPISPRWDLQRTNPSSRSRSRLGGGSWFERGTISLKRETLA